MSYFKRYYRRNIISQKDNLKKYLMSENVNTEFDLAKARVEAESRYLRIKGKDIAIYQKMMSYMIFDNPIKSVWRNKLTKAKVNFKQSELWKYGISGDCPIILVKIKDVNDGYIIKEVLKAYEYFRTKNIITELVIIDEEKYSYENYVKEEIEGNILNNHMSYLKNIRGGIFILSKEEIDKKDIELLEFVSSIIIDSNKGGLENNIKEIEEEYLDSYKDIGNEENVINTVTYENKDIDLLENNEKYKYYNEYGAFSEDGKEYIIRTNKNNRLPTVWSHIMANEKFGTVVTENMGGYSWYKNSRLNRITSWENNASYDIPSEIIYMKDMDTNKVWSLGLNPKPDDRNYNIVYGFGYCKYIHSSCGVEQELNIFVPKEDSCKIGILTLRNTTPNHKKFKLYYYIKPVLEEDEIKSNGYIKANFDRNNNVITLKNLYRNDLENTEVYVSSSEKIKSFTSDKHFFLGRGGIYNPDGINKIELNNDTGLGKESCIAYEIEIELDSFENRELSIVLGAEEKFMERMTIQLSKNHLAKLEMKNLVEKIREINKTT